MLPLAGGALGIYAVTRRRRSAATPAAPADALEAERLREQLAHVDADMAEVAVQVAEGELDAGTGSELQSGLEAEAGALATALASVPEPGEGDEGEEPAARPRGLDRRAMLGIGILLVGALVVGTTLVLTADDSGDGGIVDAPPIDPSTVTPERLEEVIAANPDILPMRLALAGLLLEEGEVLRAAQHYGEVLQRDPANPEALAALGWISFLVEEHETAEGYLVDALSVAPDYGQALWWLANVRIAGLGDTAGAIDPLERLLAFDDLPADIRANAEQLLTAAKDGQ